jgi:hypothetical protein
MPNVRIAHTFEHAVPDSAPGVRSHNLHFNPEFAEDDVGKPLRVRREIYLISKVGPEFLEKMTRPILEMKRAAVFVACANVLCEVLSQLVEQEFKFLWCHSSLGVATVTSFF